MKPHPSDIQQQVETVLKCPIRSIRGIMGGQISHAFEVSSDAASYFLKTNSTAQAAAMFKTEAAGLALLALSASIKLPEVIDFGTTSVGSYILMSFHSSGMRPKGFWEDFGAALAQFHRTTAPDFGLDHNNFIGSLPQSNGQHSTWPSFYWEERIMPQLKISECQKGMQTIDFQEFEKFYLRLSDLFPEEPPALVHGDLWSGNFLCGTDGAPVLFDPAASFSHREMDLAMTRLFGGFDRPFYRGYEEVWPLAPGFEERLPAYQLYYLLVHMNLFGGSYLRSVREILKHFI